MRQLVAFVCLTNFTCHNDLQFHLYWHKWQDLIVNEIITVAECKCVSSMLMLHIFFIYFISQWTLILLLFVAVVNSATINVSTKMYFDMLISFIYYLFSWKGLMLIKLASNLLYSWRWPWIPNSLLLPPSKWWD